MAQLAIKGHETRGREVIELLEMLGGVNSYTYEGCERNSYFTISNYSSIINVFPSTNYAIFTFFEFLEKFPYKVGDKVIYDKDTELEIVKMYWDNKFNIVRYDVQGVVDKTFTLKGLMTTHFLRYKDITFIGELENFVECIENTVQECLFGKEETKKKEISGAIIDRFICLEGYDFYDDKGSVINTTKIVLKKKDNNKLKLESTKKVQEYWSEYARIFIEIYDDKPNECVLTHLYTLESHRQKGYGKQALFEAESIAKELGCHTAYIKVETDSWMHQWYLRCGYQWCKNADKEYTWLIKNLI